MHELDQQFHQRLWELTDNSLLVEIAAQMRSRTSHFYRAAAPRLRRTSYVGTPTATRKCSKSSRR